MAQGILEASVAAGESGRVIMLAGEADLTCAAELAELIAAEMAGETRQLTIDVSGLRFADSASIRVLLLAARTLTKRGGSLVLLDPQRPVARVLALLGADQMIAIRDTTEATPGLSSEQGNPEATPTQPCTGQMRTSQAGREGNAGEDGMDRAAVAAP